MDKEGGREKGGWTDGRGYAWLKGTRWEEADAGVLCACACYWRKRHILLLHMLSSLLRHPSLSSLSPLSLLSFDFYDSLCIDVKSALNPSK